MGNEITKHDIDDMKEDENSTTFDKEFEEQFGDEDDNEDDYLDDEDKSDILVED